jgi:hypothetical protein
LIALIILVSGIAFNYLFGEGEIYSLDRVQPNTWFAFGITCLMLPALLIKFEKTRRNLGAVFPLIGILLFALAWLPFCDSQASAVRFMFRIFFVAVFCVVFVNESDSDDVYFYTKMIFLSGIITVLLGVIKPVYVANYLLGTPDDPDRFAGIGSTLLHAHVMSLLIAFAYYLYRIGKMPPLLSWLLIGIFFWQLVLTQTRSATIGLLVCLSLTELVFVGKRTSLLAVLVIVVGIGAVAFSEQLRFRFVDPLMDRTDIQSWSAGRIEASAFALNRLVSPATILIGSGPGATESLLNDSLLQMTHNDYLVMFLDLGVAGAFMLLWFLLRMLRRSWKFAMNKRSEEDTIVGTLAVISLVALMIRMTMDTVLNNYMHMVVYMVFPLIAFKRIRHDSEVHGNVNLSAG